MNLDIQTEHILMRPEWHRLIDDWAHRCARQHPALDTVDLTLRHDEVRHPPEEVAVVATARGRTLRAMGHADLMTVALHGALDVLERQLETEDAPGSCQKAWTGSPRHAAG